MTDNKPDKARSSHTLDPQAWVDKYADWLYAFIANRIADKEIAWDLVQETFLSAWKNRDSYKGEASEKNWLFTICRNKIFDYYRKRASEIISYKESDRLSQDYFDETGVWYDKTKPHPLNTDEKMESQEFYQVLNGCMDQLRQLQRAVFVMKYMEDMPSDEICKVLNLSPSYYWVLMHRAKLGLRHCMEKNWFEK